MSVTYTAPTIDYEDVTFGLANGPVESFSQNGFTATRFLKCAWADRLTLADQLQTAYQVAQSGRVYRIGDLYPHKSGVYVRSVSSIRPAGKSSTGANAKTAAWSDAMLTVEYEERQFNPNASADSSDSSSDPAFVIATETFETSAEFLTLPNQTLYWDNAQAEPLKDLEVPTRIIGMGDWAYEFDAESELDQDLADNTGYCNSGALTAPTLGLNFAAETLLYRGLRVRREIVLGSNTVRRVSLRFTYRPSGWNKFFRSGEQTAQVVYDSSGTEFKPVPTANFVSMLGTS